MLRRLHIRLLKRRLRKAYYAYHGILDEYDCGAHMASIVSPRLQRTRDAYNSLVRRLKKVDPSAGSLNELTPP